MHIWIVFCTYWLKISEWKMSVASNDLSTYPAVLIKISINWETKTQTNIQCQKLNAETLTIPARMRKYGHCSRDIYDQLNLYLFIESNVAVVVFIYFLFCYVVKALNMRHSPYRFLCNCVCFRLKLKFLLLSRCLWVFDFAWARILLFAIASAYELRLFCTKHGLNSSGRSITIISSQHS